jgi:DMSO/TMAO reductase YedYZ molybdopterin-dependent catalytic subunit
MRRPPVPSEESFTSTLRGPEVAARVGTWLGICFTVAFLTGVWSHLYQDQPGWLTIPTHPVWIYRVTQGLHVVSGTAAIPLLLVKLYAVYPKLFQKVPVGKVRTLTLHLLERGSIALLVGAGIFQLVTGVMNTAEWYAWGFSFRSSHYAMAWVAIGALALHVAVKLTIIRDAYRRPLADGERPAPELTRRGLVRVALGASAVGVLAVAGQAVPWLARLSVFETHSGAGPQDLPVTRSARAARVTQLAFEPSYALEVVHKRTTRTLSLDQLRRLPQHTETLPIACVEGWSRSAVWTGVRLRDLLDLVGAPAGTTVRVQSLQPRGPFRTSEVRGNLADDPSTLVALRLNGEPLSIDHGHPCRLIAPNRPGVLQTKWLARVVTT